MASTAIVDHHIRMILTVPRSILLAAVLLAGLLTVASASMVVNSHSMLVMSADVSCAAHCLSATRLPDVAALSAIFVPTIAQSFIGYSYAPAIASVPRVHIYADFAKPPPDLYRVHANYLE
jgi:hypothetical protein